MILRYFKDHESYVFHMSYDVTSLGHLKRDHRAAKCGSGHKKILDAEAAYLGGALQGRLYYDIYIYTYNIYIYIMDLEIWIFMDLYMD